MAALDIEGLSVQDKSKNAVKLAKKEGGVIGLYFSAHWCPPCRAFTPKLSEFYAKVKAAEGDKFEIVFVSSDQDEAGFNDYFGSMPWLAMPFEQRDKKAALGKQYSVSGIPKLVFVDMGTGKTITEKARDIVSVDPNGEEFPWSS